MGLGVKNDSRFCQIPTGSKKGLNRHLKPRAFFMAVSLTLILTTAGLVVLQPPPAIPPPIPSPPSPLELTPHSAIAIDGDANFSATALIEGWPGDGSPENPFIINGLDIDLDGEFGHCIDIWNTRVSFTISNCNLTGAVSMSGVSTIWGAGIALHNVSNGVLVNNTCSSNDMAGIISRWSTDITIVNNTCNNNGIGVRLLHSNTNVVANNTCTSNWESGISLDEICEHNTVANNICNNNEFGIELSVSDFNTVANNTCNSNDIGISLGGNSNTVENNTCTNNGIGICIGGNSNTVENNTFSGNTEHDIVTESELEELAHQEYLAKQFMQSLGFLLLVGVVGIIMLGAGWRIAKLWRLQH
jgi:parallel beta-helix repeat protein